MTHRDVPVSPIFFNRKSPFSPGTNVKVNTRFRFSPRSPAIPRDRGRKNAAVIFMRIILKFINTLPAVSRDHYRLCRHRFITPGYKCRVAKSGIIKSTAERTWQDLNGFTAIKVVALSGQESTVYYQCYIVINLFLFGKTANFLLGII